MTDIIDIFLDPNNVEKMNTMFISANPRTAGGDRNVAYSPMMAKNCGMRSYMHEFIYGPYMAGLYDIWTGTDADLYLRHMNDEFIKYMEVRYKKRIQSKTLRTPSARVEIASYLDPFERAHEQAVRVGLAMPRRPITRGTGASMGGAKITSPCTPTSCSLRPEPAMNCACRGGISGARASTSGRRDAGARSAGDVQRLARARPSGPSARPGALVDEMYARQNRDQGCTVHLMSRDDEASESGIPLSYTRRFGVIPDTSSPPFDFNESNPWLSDPTSGSGDAQYHLLVLDSQMSVLNEERTLPYGYGTAQEQLADDARVAARHRNTRIEEGVIPRTNYKKLVRVQAPNGRVTLDDDRIMANDIFSRDSKGFILAGRH